MCRFVLCCVIVIPLGAICAQGPRSRYETVVKEMLDAVQRMNGALKSVQNPTSAQAARGVLKDAVTRFVAARRKAEKMKLPELDEKNRIERRYGTKMARAVALFLSERRRVRGIPGGVKVLEELKPLLASAKKNAKKKKTQPQSNLRRKK